VETPTSALYQRRIYMSITKSCASCGNYLEGVRKRTCKIPSKATSTDMENIAKKCNRYVKSIMYIGARK